MAFIAVSGIIMILLGMLFLIPNQAKRKKKKKKEPVEITPQEQELMNKAARLEKYIQSLRDEAQAFQGAEKDHEKNLAIEKAKVKKFQEKLSQEREWQEKERN